jgi:hypothetical protein
MLTIIRRTVSRRFQMALLGGAVALALGACGGGTTPYSLTSGSSSSGGASGGGGGTTTASPYGLFSSTYIAYSAQTNGAWLHSIQGGDLYTGSGGNLMYGGYSASQADMNRTGLYIVQTQAATTAPTTAADYYYVALKAPADATFDISQSSTLVIQVGNSYNATSAAPGGHATVFQLGINDAPASGAASNSCTYNLTLTSEGSGVAQSALGVRTYAIPLSSFSTCSAGSMAAMQTSGITTVAVVIVGSQNSSMVAGEYNTIAIGNVGFMGAVTAAETTALTQ